MLKGLPAFLAAGQREQGEGQGLPCCVPGMPMLPCSPGEAEQALAWALALVGVGGVGLGELGTWGAGHLAAAQIPHWQRALGLRSVVMAVAATVRALLGGLRCPCLAGPVFMLRAWSLNHRQVLPLFHPTAGWSPSDLQSRYEGTTPSP